MFKAIECGLHKHRQGYAQWQLCDIRIKCKLLQQDAIRSQEQENSEENNKEAGMEDRRKLTRNTGIVAVCEGR